MRKLFRKRRRKEVLRARREVLWGLAITAAVAVLYSANTFISLEFSLFDWLTRLRGPIPAAPRVVIVEIGQESLDTIKKWPIPRDVYARLLRILSSAGASSVGFNIMFTEEGPPGRDEELASAMRAAKNVYLPYYIESLPQIESYVRLVDNLPLFKDAARGEGQINMPPDMDGVVRHAPLAIMFDGAPRWQLGFLMACEQLGAVPTLVGTQAGESVAMKTRFGQTVPIPADGAFSMELDWNGPWKKVFTHYTLADILESADRESRGEAPRVPLERFRDRICLVGITAPGAFDVVRTPFEGAAPSIAVHANIISQIIQGRFAASAPRRVNICLIILMGLAASLLIPRLRPAAAAKGAAAVCVLYAAIVVVLFIRYRYRLSAIYPLASLIFPYLILSIRQEIAISMERARLLHLATHDGLTGLYNVGQVRLLLEAGITESRREGRPLSLIMSDIDRFKECNDAHGHQAGDFILREVAAILRSSCRELDIVGRYGGEEFILLLPDSALEEARQAAERIRVTVERNTFRYEGKNHRVTISLGVAELMDSDASEDLIRRADEALYMAKRRGRNRVCAASPSSSAAGPASLL